MFKRLLYAISSAILCGADFFCLPAWGASIVGNEVTLLHTQSPAQGTNCPNGTYTLTLGSTLYSNMIFSQMPTCPTDYRRADFGDPYIIGDTVAVTTPLFPQNTDNCPDDTYAITLGSTLYSNMIFSHMPTCPTDYRRLNFDGSYIIGDTVAVTNPLTGDQGNCPDGDYTITISSAMYNDMTFSQTATNCPTSDYKKIKFNGVTMGGQDTVCDNGYLKNGSCVSYVSFGYQPGFYNLDLNTNTYTDPTNNTCASGYYETSTLHPYFEKCMAAGTEIQLTWEGVDVTGTDAASCYYLGDLYAPTTAPTNVPHGYKFLGWRPRQQ